MQNIGWLLLALVIGTAVGAAASWLLWRSRTGESGAHDQATLERARTEAAQAQTQAAEGRAEAAQARSELSRLVADVAQAREDAALARAEAADAGAALSHARAKADGAIAERDAAVARAKELAEDRESIINQFKVLSAETAAHQAKQGEAVAEQRLKATEQLMVPVKESLERFNNRLTEVEKERAAISTDLRNQVAEVKLTGEALRRETAALVTALRKPQVRGAWGELQLKRVAEISGMLEYCDFVQQETTQTSSGAVIRPDMKVTLAEGKFVYVDSKVPLSAFLDAHEANNDTERERCLGLFAKNVQSHIDQLSRKDYYKADPSSPEFVVLFLASEALAAEALSQLPDLHDYAARRNIILATPTTLIAMLRAIAYSWRQAALADSAKEVFGLGRELYDRLGTLGKHFDKVGRSLTGAVSAYNDAVGSIEGRVFPTARKLRELQVVTKDLDAVNSVDVSVRHVSAPELVEDAAGVAPMIGRTRSRGDELALNRSQPELEDLLTGEVSTPPDAGAQTA